jgi:hypothetical protein
MGEKRHEICINAKKQRTRFLIVKSRFPKLKKAHENNKISI